MEKVSNSRSVRVRLPICTASGGGGNGARREVGEDDDGTNGTVSLSPDGMRAMELPDEDSDEEGGRRRLQEW